MSSSTLKEPGHETRGEPQHFITGRNEKGQFVPLGGDRDYGGSKDYKDYKDYNKDYNKD